MPNHLSERLASPLRRTSVQLGACALVAALSAWASSGTWGPRGGAAAEAEPAREAVVVRRVVFEGACDASGAVPIDHDHFAVADDEDNVLRIYDARRGGQPIRKINLTHRIALDGKGEIDIEAATRRGDGAYWLSSHARNAKGDADPNRSVLVVTDVPDLRDRVRVQFVYRRLLDDLTADARFSKYQLGRAASLAPKEPGGLNIEGLTAAPGGELWVGFRSPLFAGRALLASVLNPDGLAEGERVRLGDPLELDLGGLGVRSLSWWRGHYLIAAGPTSGSAAARLYAWLGPGNRPYVVAEDALGDANPEALFTAEGNDRVLLLSDDGSVEIRGKPCKRQKKRKHKRFRGIWLDLRGLVEPGSLH